MHGDWYNMCMSNISESLILDRSELDNEIDFKDFKFRSHFKKLCDIKADINLEKLFMINVNEDLNKKSGLVYAIVINGKLFKIGQTITSFSKRLQSYNCGKKEYRERGTCSVTNYYILQSLLNISTGIEIFVYPLEKQKYSLFGEWYTDDLPIGKKAEKVIMNQFKNGKIPKGNIQK